MPDHAKLVADLERSNRDLARFAYAASHDIQEPLRTVAAFVPMLLETIPDPTPEQSQFAGFITAAVRRAQAMVNDLLTLSRVGKSLKLVPVNLQGEAERAVDALAADVRDSGAVVVFDDPLPTVIADASLAGRLLQNLIGNAIKFRNGTTPEIHIGARFDGSTGAWRITVADNGIGIAPEYRVRVFEIFQRLHAQDEYSGTGMGLALCQSIVEHFGWTIGVEANEPKGSVFWFEVPGGQD
jgi:light-regulated signal transduction histidine kinase (bacteriophytochrome)